MMDIILSILIPTTPDRTEETENLSKVLSKQFTNRKCDVFDKWGDVIYREWDLLSNIECIKYYDDKSLTIGEKRERLYSIAKGKYSWQLDSDDSISKDAIKLIMAAIDKDPDCITFHEHCSIDGGFFSSRHSLEYGDWEGTGDHILPDGFNFHRTPFFKDVIKTEIARSVPIPHIRWAEDHQWAQALKPHLKTEVHIPEYLYYYIHNSSNPVERYGLDK